MNKYLLTNGKEVILTKEQLKIISFPIDIITALELLKNEKQM